MLDLHTHTIFGVDDGSKDLKDSINILKNAKAAGFSGVVFTPHYIEGSYTVNNKDKNELMNVIRAEAKVENIDIDIYIGNEVFITENIEHLLRSGKISSINNSRYVLIELPMLGANTNLQNCIFRLFSLGYIPIVAHPERYEFVQKDPNILLDYIDQGVLFQLNSGSLFGSYGRRAEKASKILLKNKMIQFIASDTHSGRGYSYSQISEVYKLACKLTSKDITDALMTNNPTDVINNIKIEIIQPTKYKKPLLDFLK